MLKILTILLFCANFLFAGSTFSLVSPMATNAQQITQNNQSNMMQIDTKITQIQFMYENQIINNTKNKSLLLDKVLKAEIAENIITKELVLELEKLNTIRNLK